MGNVLLEILWSLSEAKQREENEEEKEK